MCRNYLNFIQCVGFLWYAVYIYRYMLFYYCLWYYYYFDENMVFFLGVKKTMNKKCEGKIFSMILALKFYTMFIRYKQLIYKKSYKIKHICRVHKKHSHAI